LYMEQKVKVRLDFHAVLCLAYGSHTEHRWCSSDVLRKSA
jgi:hypothetical protein